eukprot:scaffold283428_cov17-Prasinocladus_malaysianus.AAC.1
MVELYEAIQQHIDGAAEEASSVVGEDQLAGQALVAGENSRDDCGYDSSDVLKITVSYDSLSATESQLVY